MYDFQDVRRASHEQQIRAWSVDMATTFLPIGQSGQDLINVSKMIEDYVTDGDVTNVITSAVEEGYNEGRFEVKEAVEEWFSNVDLDDLFRTKGWVKTGPENGE